MSGWVDVQWDKGGSNSYRMGAEGKFDLTVASPEDGGPPQDMLPPMPVQSSGSLQLSGASSRQVLISFGLLYQFRRYMYWGEAVVNGCLSASIR